MGRGGERCEYSRNVFAGYLYLVLLSGIVVVLLDSLGLVVPT